MEFRKNLPFNSYGVEKPICRAHRQPLSRSFGTNETQQLREGQLVGRMLLQRLATGATGVKQARYRRGSTRGSEALVRACAVYTQPVYRSIVFNVRQRMVYMNSAEGLLSLSCVCVCVCVCVSRPRIRYSRNYKTK